MTKIYIYKNKQTNKQKEYLYFQFCHWKIQPLPSSDWHQQLIYVNIMNEFRSTWMTSRGATALQDTGSSVCLQIGELISEFVLKGHRGPGEWLFLLQREQRQRGGEGQEEASRVAVMAFQGKLRRRELFGSASAEWWPLFTQVVNASSPPHTRHNSFSSQSASEQRLSDCHCPWFITPVPATGAECHQASATLQSHYKAPVSHPDLLLGSTCQQCANLLQEGTAGHKATYEVMVCQDLSWSLFFDCNRLVQ